MKTLLWQTQSPYLYACLNSGQPGPGVSGGHAYDSEAFTALKKNHGIILDTSVVFPEKSSYWSYLWRLYWHRPEADIVITDPYTIAFGGYKKNTYTIGLVHHIDPLLRQGKITHRWYIRQLEKKLPKLNVVVTVSEYWKKYMEEIGCRNVHTIYNSFDVGSFIRSEEEIEAFKEKYKQNVGKPLIYIGNASREKGVYESYEQLKACPYTLVMTGAVNNAPDLPVNFYNFDKYDYITLLNCCDVVLTMSLMMEGWNRVAHEAMLCRKPVIGTGTGGMSELLNGGEQIVLNDWLELRSFVEHCLSKGDEIGARGFDYVSQFDRHYFENAWCRLVDGI